MTKLLERIVISIALVGCATACSTQAARDVEPAYITEVTNRSVTKLGENLFVVRDPLIFRLTSDAQPIIVPAGFLTDLASIPKTLHWWEGKVDRTMAAAIVHDYLYWYQPCHQHEADAIILHGMRAMKTSTLKAESIHFAVAQLGKVSFAENTRLRSSGEIRTLKPSFVQELAVENANPDATLKSTLIKARKRDGLVDVEIADPSVKATCHKAAEMLRSAQ